MVRYLDRTVYTSTRPSRLLQLQGSLPDVARFRIKRYTICIPTYLLLQAPNVFNTAMQNGKSLETWIEQAEHASRTHTAFDVVFTPLIYGSLDVHTLIDIENTQVRYSQSNMDTDNDPLHTLHTVTLDLDILLNSIWLAVTIQAVEVAKMISDEVSNEYSDTLLEVPQIRKLTQAGGYAAEFVVEWSFEFTNSNHRTAAVETMFYERLGETLSVCKEYRNLIHQRPPEYKTRREVKIQEASRIIESDLTFSSLGYEGPMNAPAGQREVAQGVEKSKGSSKQAGLPVIEDMDTSSSEASPDSRPTSRTIGTTVAATRFFWHRSRGKPGDIFDDIEHPAAGVHTSNITHTRSTPESVSGSQANIALKSQNFPAGTPVLEPRMSYVDPDSQHEEAPPTLPMSHSKINEATNQAKEQTANGASTFAPSAPASAYEPQTFRGGSRTNKRSAPGKESDDAMGPKIVPRTKQARTNKRGPAALPPPPSHDTEEAALDQIETKAQPLAVTRKAPNPAAEPGRSILKNTMRTTGTSAAAFDAEAALLAGTTARPLRQILPASPSLNMPSGTNLPFPPLPGRDGPNSGLDGSTVDHGTVSALAQPSDPPDAFGQSGLSNLEAPSSQNELKPPTALMSRAEGKNREGSIIRVAADLLPPATGGLEYMLEEVLGFDPEEFTTPPESPPSGIVQANDIGKGKANANQPHAVSIEAPTATTTQAVSAISHQPNITGLAPYLDPSARGSALGRLLAQLPSPAIAAPAPSTTASDITFPDMQAAKKTSTGKARAEQPNKPTRKAPAPRALKLDVNKKSKAATAKAMAQLKATTRKLTADIAAIKTASQNAASASLPQTATAVPTARPIPVLPVPAATTTTQATPTQATPTQTAPTQASNTQAPTRAAPSCASTRATSTGATTTQAARAPAAMTRVAARQVSTNAPATTTQSSTNAPAATSTPLPPPPPPASNYPTASATATATTQPAPAPCRSSREHKGQRTTKHYGR